MPIVPQQNEASQVAGFNNSEDLYISAQTTARNLITDPTKMIPIPKYFLRGWVGYLTPSEMALLIGLRQAGFLSKAVESIMARRLISTSHIGYWSGLKKQRVSKILMSIEESYLSWFVKKVNDPSENTGLKNSYDIRVNYPLSPWDIGIVTSAINKLFPLWRNENPDGSMIEFLSYLEYEIEHRSKKYFEDEKYLPKKGSEFISVHSILSNYFNNNTSHDSDACEEFEAKFTRPLDTFAISHYFIRHWLPEMSTSINFIILCMLRLKSYTSSNMGHIYFKNKAALAAYLHVDSRTVSQLLADINDGKSPLASFIKQINPSEGQGIELMISMIDPVHPKHISEYKRIYADLISGKPAALLYFSEDHCDPWVPPKTKFTPGVSETIDQDNRFYSYYMASYIQGICEDELLQSQNTHNMLTVGTQNVDGTESVSNTTETHKMLTVQSQNVDGSQNNMQKDDTDSIQNVDGDSHKRLYRKRKKLTVNQHSVDTSIQKVDGSAQKVDATINLINIGFNNEDINLQQQLKNTSKSQPESQVVVVNGWDINKIFDLGGIPDNGVRHDFIHEYNQSPKIGEDYIARWLFASTRKRMEGEEKGVVSPEWMAIRQYKRNTPIDFLELAKVSPDELYERYFSPENVWGAVGTKYTEIISMLKKKGFEKTLLNFVSIDPESSEDNLPLEESTDRDNENLPYVIGNTWSHILDECQRDLSEESFENYIKPLRIKYIEDGDTNKKVIIQAQSEFQAEWVDTHYKQRFELVYKMSTNIPFLEVEVGIRDP